MLKFDKNVFLVLLIVLLNVISTFQSYAAQNFSSELLQLTKAAHIKAYLNPDVDPCTDFYEYACGKWARLHPTSSKKQKTSYLDQLEDLYVRKSAELLKRDPSNNVEGGSNDKVIDIKIKNFYDSCRNKEAIKQLGMETILQIVNFKGGWPKINSLSWYDYEYDWLKTIADLRRNIGIDILVGLEVIPDFEDKDLHRIKVGAPKLGLGSRDAYVKDDYQNMRENYKHTIIDKLRRHFPDMSDNWAEEVATQVVELEKKIAVGLPIDSKLTLMQTTRQRSVAELKAAYGSYIDLSRYLNIIFNQTIYVNVYETPEDYMSNLVEVIKDTPKLTIANYTMWRVVEKFDLASEFTFHNDDLHCVRKIIEYFPHQLESMFQRNYNNMKMINELQSVWADIKEAFRIELIETNQLNWLTPEIRESIFYKVKSIELKILDYSEENQWFQTSGLELLFSKDKYYENLVQLLNWQTKIDLAKLIDKPEEKEPDVKLPKYIVKTNKIEIPISFLQTRFFWDAAYPNAIKYGTVGYYLAREMLHSIDSVGRKYDKNGYQKSWWDKVSENLYDDRASCFQNQFENHIYDKTIKDNNILRNSIADNGGIAISYLAYQKWLENTPKATKEELPKLHFSRNQLFFVSFAQVWCAAYDDSLEKLNEVPEHFRVNGALLNSNEFSTDFECDKFTKLNPPRKCKIF